jgi:hypothetical protein
MTGLPPSARRVRPSSLQLAEECDLAPYLSTVYPASRAETRMGSTVDAQVTAIVKSVVSGDTSDLPTDEEIYPETERIMEWLEATYHFDEWEYFVQERVELLDPETGDLLTAGTPDLMCLHRTLPVLVDIDWKKRGQMWAGHLKRPDENLQQLAYVTAAWLKHSLNRKIEQAKIVLACWDAEGVTPLESEWITEDMLTDVVDRVRAVPPIDLDKPRPEAAVGEHCLHCYQRMHCPEHLLPPAVVAAAGIPEPFAEFSEEPLSSETVVQALAWREQANNLLRAAEKIRDLVEGNINAYVAAAGPVQVGEMMYGPRPTNGRRCGATVATLEKEGLQRLIRPATPGKPQFKWYPVPKTLGAVTP